MAAPLIKATPRFGKRKSDLKAIRSEGNIPAVIYGQTMPPASIVLVGREFKERAAGHRMIQVDFQGRQIPAMVQDIMRHPVDRTILHIELHAVSMEEEVQSQVPVILHGLEKVEKSGGIIQQQKRDITVSGFAAQIPDYILAEVSHVHIGDVLRVKDLVMPQGIVSVSDEDEVIMSVVAPKTTVTESPAMPDAVPSAQSV